jgi:hypothetical protein
MIIFYIVIIVINMQLHYQLYFLSFGSLHIIYALVFLGIFKTIPTYIHTWNYAVQVFLCLFLMFRYRPFRKEYTFNPIDARLIFGAALLLFFNTVSISFMEGYLRYIETSVNHLLIK